MIAYGLLPGLALALTCGAGLLKWQDGAVRDAAVARAESVRAATDGTTALLSYRPDTVQHDLESARSRLTGTFLDAYTQLTHDVVIPGAQQKQISAVATVAAAASVSTSADRAVVLLFVNQTITVGKDAPARVRSGADFQRIHGQFSSKDTVGSQLCPESWTTRWKHRPCIWCCAASAVELRTSERRCQSWRMHQRRR